MSHPPWGQLLVVQFYGTRTFHGYAERELVNYDFFFSFDMQNKGLA